MKKKLKLKPYVLPSVYLIFVIGLTIGTYFVAKNMKQNKINPDYNYVSSIILSKDIPVINETTRIIKPFTSETVEIGKYYYDFKGEAENQERSLTRHDNTYIQNSGLDYKAEETFEIVSVLNGTVTKVTEDDLLGKIIEIKHDNDYITVYQSLSEVSVKKGEVVTQGQAIGKSGMNEIDKDLGNHLHFEMYLKGMVVNPEEYIDKDISSKEE